MPALNDYGTVKMPRSDQIFDWLFRVLLLVAICSLFFARGLSFWLMLLLTSLVAIHVIVEFLTRGIPANLRDLSSANRLRMDGTLSSRRSSLERRAMRKIRSDLWATFLIVGFVGAISVIALQSQFPIKLVPDVVSAALDSSNDLKLALKERGVDRQFSDWSESESYHRNENTRERQEWVWKAWPAILILMLTVFVGCMAFVRFAYIRTLQEFAIGVNSRSMEYLNRDIGRLQG